MTNRVRHIITMVAVICCCVFSYAEDTDKPIYDRFAAMGNEELIRLAESYISQDSMRKEAAEALSVVTCRYYEHPSDTALRRTATIAMRHLGNLQMAYDIDYRKAYRNLRTAQQMAEEDGNDYQLAYIYNSLVNLYIFASSEREDNEKSWQLLIEAANAALRSSNQDMMPVIVFNMVSISKKDSLLWRNHYEEKINEILSKEFSPKYKGAAQMASHVVKSRQALLRGDIATAENELLTARSIDVADNYAERYRYGIAFMLLQIYGETGQEEKALALLRSSLSDAVAGGHTDYELSLYKDMADIYRSMNNTDSMESYERKYNELEQSFHYKQGYQNMAVIDLLDEIDEINKEVELFSFRQQEERRKRVVVISVLVVVLILLGAMVWVYLNLRRNHRSLFMRNEEMIKREKNYHLLRDRLMSENQELTERLLELETAKKDDSGDLEPSSGKTEVDNANLPTDDAGDENIETLEETCDEGVADEQQLKLYTSILKVMEESEAIYNPGFSLKDLAQLVGIPSRSVSKAINVCHNSNFHTFLNEYRIREVTRLMHDSATSNHTIESIAEQAGFKSRSSFSHLFKKTTGLTPTEYLRMARSRQQQ